MITIQEITLELMHEYYKNYQTDSDIYMDMTKYKPYVYDEDKVNANYVAKMAKEDQKDFFILNNDSPIGEICLKHIDYAKKQCELSIHMQNDKVKNKGYGSQAEKLLIKYAFDILKMEIIYADAVLKNLRSQHVLEKVGFDFVKEEGIFKYYQLTQKKYKKMCKTSNY